MRKVPTVKSYLAGPKLLKKWPDLAANSIVPCPFCCRIHLHGREEGERGAHCPGVADYPFAFEGRKRPDSYRLKHAGITNDVRIFSNATKALRKKRNDWVRQQEIARRERQRKTFRLAREAFKRMRKEASEAEKAARALAKGPTAPCR